MRKIDEHHHISLVLGHIFKDNEGICTCIYAYQYNIAIMWLCDLNTMYKDIGGVYSSQSTCFMRKMCLIIEWSLTENQPVLEVG